MQTIAKDLSIVPIDTVKPYEGNARRHSQKQIAKIAASITEFGFNAPILIDADNTIVAGHGRYEAAKALGLTEVPVIMLGHLTDAKRKAYVIADNRIAEDASWDMTKLALEVQELQGEDFDLDLTGLDSIDLTRVDLELRKMAADLEMFDEARADPAYTPPAQQPQPHQPVAAPVAAPAPADDGTPAAAPAPTPPAAAPQPLAPIPVQEPLVPFNSLLTVEQREVVLRVLNTVKAEQGLKTMGEALFAVCAAFDK